MERGRDGLWRWRYLDTSESTFLLSNQRYATRGQAQAAALTAYPGVPILEVPPSVEPSSARRLAAFLGLSLVAAASGGIAIVVIILGRAFVQARRVLRGTGRG